ncbi:MAG: N-acetyltransferase [candidate division Zixibacteria bacterium]|nr:N-acetyltransferase [candidate division Zixibacteria bacterium]
MTGNKHFIHETAIVETHNIGDGTRIWAFCNIQKGGTIGADCNICDHCFVEANVVVGDRVTIKNGVSLWDGVVIEDDVFVGPSVVFTNDIRPRSKAHRTEYDRTLVRQGATIGAGVTIVAGNTIGRYAFVGAGAVVTHDVPDFTLCYGNPARLKGYVCRCGERLDFNSDYLDQNTTGTRSVCACGLHFRLDADQVICES